MDPVSAVFTQPRGVHSIKIADEDGDFAAETNPYFSLTDFTNNRIIRGSENDTSPTPILASWNEYSPVGRITDSRITASYENEPMYFYKSLTEDWEDITN